MAHRSPMNIVSPGLRYPRRRKHSLEPAFEQVWSADASLFGKGLVYKALKKIYTYLWNKNIRVRLCIFRIDSNCNILSTLCPWGRKLISVKSISFWPLPDSSNQNIVSYGSLSLSTTQLQEYAQAHNEKEWAELFESISPSFVD